MRLVAMRRLGALVLGLGLLGSLGVAPVLAASIVVNSLADTAADDGLCTLREAITAANTDTSSGASPGECPAGSGPDAITFSVPGTITLTSALPQIFSELSITGAGAITISGANSYQVLHLSGASISLSGLTITAASGGGIVNTVGTMTISDSTITGNIGSGIINGHGLLSITNSIITGNTASHGGGIDNALGRVTITNSTIEGNTATGSGGGIFNGSGSVSVTNSTISGNTAQAGNGGGIHNLLRTTVISNSTIAGNVAEQGGGIYNDIGSVDISNSTITENVSAAVIDGHGGGIANTGTLTTTESAINGNRSDNRGGGVFNAGTATLTNSTITGNFTSLAGAGIYNSGALIARGVTISENTVQPEGEVLHFGGGIYNDGSVDIANSTIAKNVAFGGAGILNGGSLTASSVTISGNLANESGGLRTIGSLETSLTNTIVAGNELPDVLGPLTNLATSVIGIPSGLTLADILVLDNLGKPVLADNGGPTKTIALALAAGNPAIDTGTGAACAASPVSGLDQRGRTRPSACDIGASEAQAPTIAAHADVSAAATSAAGAVVTFTAPVGTTEPGGAATVACLPASGSIFPVGTTTVTCTATDPVGHTATTTFQVILSAFVSTASPFIPTVPPTDGAATDGPSDAPGLPLVLGLLGLIGLVALRRPGPMGRRS